MSGDGEEAAEYALGRGTEDSEVRPRAEADREALYRRAARERFETHRADLALVDRVISPSRFPIERWRV